MGLIEFSKTAARWLGARVDLRSRRGGSSVEYGIILFAITAVIVVAVFFLGTVNKGNFDCAVQAIKTSTSGC